MGWVLPSAPKVEPKLTLRTKQDESCLSRLHPLSSLVLFLAMDYQIGSGYEEDGDNHGDQKATDDGPGQWRILLAARF